MKLAFLGTGNMGAALAKAAAKVADNQLYLVNRHPEKAKKLQEIIGGEVCDHGTAVSEADMIFLGVKPYLLAELIQGILPALSPRNPAPVVISMAAGKTIAQVQELLGGGVPVIRIMPNTPVAVSEGMILYCCSPEVTPVQIESFLIAMRYAGRFLEIDEHLMDAGMAISGCGPAYVDLFVEAMADAGVAAGLPRKDAVAMAAQMVLGSAKLILESGKHPGELKDAVCSPGGTTIQGVRKLEEKGFRSAVMEAVLAAYNA